MNRKPTPAYVRRIRANRRRRHALAIIVTADGDRAREAWRRLSDG